MLVKDLQERAARAMPAEECEVKDGWWLRAAPRCSWWVGTVLAHGGSDDLPGRIADAEKFYARRGTPARFQITPGVAPAGLDALLEERGYQQETFVSLQVASDVAGGSEQVRVDDRMSPEWFDVWAEVNGDPSGERDMLGRVQAPSGYARALIDGETVGIGRVVVEDGWAGIFGMATLPRARGRGVGGAVLAGLAQWARERGGNRLYLQVVASNAAALGLYERAGFREVCRYHYRTPRHVVVTY